MEEKNKKAKKKFIKNTVKGTGRGSKADSTKNLYDMSKLFYEQLPDAIKPEIKAKRGTKQPKSTIG